MPVARGAVAMSLCASDFKGFDENDGFQQMWLGVPDKMQVSCYNASRSDHSGGYYKSHFDGCSDSISTMGLLGYLRSLYLRRRYLTCIVYLNADWEPSHGGCLRITSRDGSTFRNVEPIAGRLVLFSSTSCLHAVLPTYHERFACSMWLTRNRT